jgi:hypothetical protein
MGMQMPSDCNTGVLDGKTLSSRVLTEALAAVLLWGKVK